MEEMPVNKKRQHSETENESTTTEGSESINTLLSSKKHRKQRKVPKQHRVGNFRSYYNFRLGQQQVGILEEDTRLSVLQSEWFQGKRGLDVGCNSGDVTIAIAKRFSPQYIMGIDIDPELVARARAQLKDLIQQHRVETAFKEITSKESVETKSSKVGTEQSLQATNVVEMPLSFRLWKPPKDGATPTVGKTVLGNKFPYNIVFKREDIVKDSHGGKDYDFIICFSVTKWIHLFHGDQGLQHVFRHFFNLLSPKGCLLLEPQPWKSYHKRKFTSDITKENYNQIMMRPKDFSTYLVETIGFKSCRFLQVCQTSTKGFKRPIYLVEKA